MYSIKLSKSVIKFLYKHTELGHRFLEKIEIMKYNPFDVSLDIAKMKSPFRGYRLRIGKYRFLYELIDHEVIIYFYEADSRGDIYH